MKICIVDYGLGNVKSLENFIIRLGLSPLVTSSIDEINKADKLIIPGVGHFKKGMEALESRNLINTLNKRVLVDKIPILGICLGMQLFSKYSEEGETSGLGWIDARVIKFDSNRIQLKIPHIGWNTLNFNKNSIILDSITETDFFYFVHSYHLIANEVSNIVAYTEYGYNFISVLQKENIYGVQFHPEKSHNQGAKIIENFLCKI